MGKVKDIENRIQKLGQLYGTKFEIKVQVVFGEGERKRSFYRLDDTYSAVSGWLTTSELAAFVDGLETGIARYATIGV